MISATDRLQRVVNRQLILLGALLLVAIATSGALGHRIRSIPDVDLANLAGFTFCFSGDGGIRPEACLLSGGPPCAGPDATPPEGVGHDWEPDGDVDLADFAEFQACYGTAAPDCLATFDFDAAKGVSALRQGGS